jgi:hypothetical protein
MDTNTKAKLLEQLRDKRAQWESFLAELDEAQLTALTQPDQRSIKDIIAHLMAWQRLTVARLEAARWNKPPRPTNWPGHLDPEGGVDEGDVDEINEWIYETYHTRPLAEILQAWRQVFQQVLDTSEALSEEELAEAGRYLWLGNWPLSAVLVGTYEHHDEHLVQLRDWLAKAE